MTRNQVAQMALNALRTEMVTFTGTPVDGDQELIGVDGVLGQQVVQLNNNDIDAFGRPARTWEYKGIEVGTYEKRIMAM